jgi:hypothetical protein
VPQLLRSLVVSVQVAPHIVPVHTQVPLRQTSPGLQCVPQRPQLFASLCASEQEPEQHCSVPPGELGQTLPQPPQFFTLLWASMQTPAHSAMPCGHPPALAE